MSGSEDIHPDNVLLPHQNPWAVLNKLSIAEWLRAHGKFVRPELTKKQRLELKECFELIDADGSGAISSSEMLTAFHVLNIRAKRSEVEEMLAEVDADGSGEVEYPEFVQIMTTKMDAQTQDEEPRASKPGKAQPLPFPLLAQAYRRKKLMEAVMQGDKATQERLQARAEEMEQERLAAIAESEAQKRQVKKGAKTSEIAKERIRRAAQLKKHEADMPLPLMENIDEDIKRVLFEVHERASLRRCSMSQVEKETMTKETAKKERERRPSSRSVSDAENLKPEIEISESTQAEKRSETIEAALVPAMTSDPDSGAEPVPDLSVKNERFTISSLDWDQKAQLSKQMQAYYKQELNEVRAIRSKLRDKPTLEQQRIKQRAVQSLGTYFLHDDKEQKWDPRGSPILTVDPVERERINTPWRASSRKKGRSPSRNASHARITYVPPPKPVKQLKFREHVRPEWINHLHLRR